MKNQFLLATILCLALNLFAGDKYDRNLNALRWSSNIINQQWNNSIYLYHTTGNIAKKNNVATVKRYAVNKKGEKILKETKTYDKNGNITKRVYGKSVYEFRYEDTLLVERTFKKHKCVYVTRYEYDVQNRMTRQVYTENGKVLDVFTFTYFEGQKIAVSEHQRKNKHTYRLETNYDSITKKPVSAVYTIDGEVEKKWNYSCDEKGQLVKDKQVELASQCSFQQENADGSYSKFTREIINGKSYLRQSDYSKDSVLTGMKSFLNDSILVYEFAKIGNVRKSTSYTDKGKKKGTYEYEEDANGNQIAQRNYNRKGKLTYHNTAKYSSSGLIETFETKKSDRLVFEYSFH